jgi:uncharacterized protein (TIGR03503 family)
MFKGFCILIIAFLLGLNSNAIAASKIDDIRILIDVSGSMKKTDPSNLRVSALKLLNGLIPRGSKAGVWTFGRYVDMSVKWGEVNDEWRKAADTGASKIHSNGLFKNIERALTRASRGWEKPDANTRRILILLTDGQVDISKKAAKNEKSRQNVLSNNIQALKKSGAIVHAIALSHFSDEVLLRQLALDTGGSFTIAETAEDLQKIFFRTFERATKPDTVKLTGNQFSIDKSIKEMTLLIFRQKDSALTLLYPPKSSPISLKKPGKSTWRSDSGYDLITIKKPKTGVWNIDADIDPDNRLMVITALKLKVAEMAPYMMPGQAFSVSAELHNKETKIKKNSFLRFVDFSISHTGPDDQENISKLEHTRVRADKGQYLFKIDQGLEEGNHSIVISADSRTFNRSKRFNVEVQWPIEVKIDPDSKPGKYKLWIKPRKEYLKPNSLQPTVVLQAPDDSKHEADLIRIKDSWRTIIETSQEGMYQAHIKIIASSVTDEAINLDLGSFPVVGVFRSTTQSNQDTKKASEAAEVLSPESKSDAGLETESEVTSGIEGDEGETGSDWIRTAIAIVVANLLMLAVAGGVWFIIRRKKIDPEFILDEQEEDA